MKALTLTAAGRLTHNEWQRPEGEAPGYYLRTDVTDVAQEFLFEQIELEPEVTIKSALLLVSSCEGLRRVLRRRQVDEILQEALGPLPDYPIDGGIDPADVDYACVYRCMERHSGTKELSGLYGPMLHGVSRVYAQDMYEGDVLMHRQGTRSGYSFEWTSARHILGLPLKLDEEVLITEGDFSIENFWEHTEKLRCTELTLAEMLDALFSELAWVGPPCEEQSAGLDA